MLTMTSVAPNRTRAEPFVYPKQKQRFAMKNNGKKMPQTRAENYLTKLIELRERSQDS